MCTNRKILFRPQYGPLGVAALFHPEVHWKLTIGTGSESESQFRKTKLHISPIHYCAEIQERILTSPFLPTPF